MGLNFSKPSTIISIAALMLMLMLMLMLLLLLLLWVVVAVTVWVEILIGSVPHRFVKLVQGLGLASLGIAGTKNGLEKFPPSDRMI
jgi:hypothetical protein